MMNERIKELIAEATAIEYGVDNGFDRVTFDKEKFAELIVRECANLAEYYNFEKNQGLINPLKTTVYEFMKEHFGVEE